MTSFVLLFFYYSNYKSATTLFTSFWFCNSKLSKGILVAKESLDNGIGYSYYNTLNLAFNRIDTKFKRHNSTSNPESQTNSNADSLNASYRNGLFCDQLEETKL